MNIARYIPKGHDNAVSREYLRITLHLPDRQIRKMIAMSREQIFWCEGGYFRHKNKDDLPYEMDYLRQERARAMALFDKVNGIEAAIYG